MSTKTKESLRIVSQEEIGKGIFSMWLQADRMAEAARPGQFLSLYTRNGSKLLPRPISICEIDRENGKESALYIELQAKIQEQKNFPDFIRELPLRQWDLLEMVSRLKKPKERRYFLIGGGIGIPPMLQTAKELKAEKTAVLGYRDELFLNEEFAEYADVYVATEDGSAGTKGNVLNAIKEKSLEADVIFACGPAPMLRALKEYAAEKNITCWISMEERMACGVGACLACVCKSKEIDAHSQVHNKRVCKDGPVFLSTEVEL